MPGGNVGADVSPAPSRLPVLEKWGRSPDFLVGHGYMQAPEGNQGSVPIFRAAPTIDIIVLPLYFELKLTIWGMVK